MGKERATIGILAWSRSETESIDLEASALRLGHLPWRFTIEDMTFTGHGERPSDLVRGCTLEHFDVILCRARLRAARWRSDMEKLILLGGLPRIRMIEPPDVYIPAESKLVELQRLARAGVRVPPTAVCGTLEAVRQRWQEQGSVVIKPSYGEEGNDVERIDDDFDGKAEMVQRLLERHGELLVQPFLPQPDGDIRVTTVGDEVAFCVKRVPPPGKWKANVAQGAKAILCEPSPEVLEMGLRAARAMKISMAGVDIIEHEGAPLVIEVNTVPGWYVLSLPDREALADKIIHFALREKS